MKTTCRISKTCSCGEIVRLDTEKAPSTDIGYWVNCKCGSTALFTHKDIKHAEEISNLLTIEKG